MRINGGKEFVYSSYAVEVRRGNPYFLKSEATRKCKDFHEGPGTECKERGGGGAVCRER